MTIYKSIALIALLSFTFLVYGRQKLPTGNETSSGGKPLTYDSIQGFRRVATGLFNVYAKEDRYFFELQDSLLGKPLLVVNRVARGAAGLRNRESATGYAGDMISEKMITFTAGPRNKIYLTNLSFGEVSVDSSGNGLSHSLSRSNMSPLVAAFDIVTRSHDSSTLVVELTSYLQAENETFYFMPAVKEISFRLGALQPDRSFIKEIKSFPTNTEIRTIRTYAASAGSALGGEAFKTLELNSSIVLLPLQPMKSRLYDPRVGYIFTFFQDYDAHPQSVKKTFLINKWRVEPKVKDRELYSKGVLVEPEKPIVFYIDPATPRKWVPYLIKGVEAWNEAFEKAGFKNAIRALEAPLSDSGWSLEDARHNAIVYKPSEIENASGPVVRDPRTGEILEAHINWYHNVLSLLHDWYFVQAGAVDSRALQYVLPDTLMGKLITYVCSHEVGHTLGLLHNWRASSMVPVDSLRSRNWVHKHGSCPSIMDYARFNYVAQPEDNIAPDDLIPRIGPYDEWAIAWGYRILFQEDPQKEQAFLSNWIVQQVDQNNLLTFGGEYNRSDPRNQAEDLGDDAVRASWFGIANLKRIMRKLISVTRDAQDDNTYLTEMYKNIRAQYVIYLSHVADRLGGAMCNAKTTRQDGPVWRFVDKKEQQRCLAFLDTTLFTNADWLIDSDIFSLTQKGSVYDVLFVQKEILKKILSPDVLGNIFWYGANEKQGYKIEVYLRELTGCIFREVVQKKNVSMLRRSLQKAYVEQLIMACLPYAGQDYGAFNFHSANVFTDVSSVVKGEIKYITSLLKSYAGGNSDLLTKMHADDLVQRMSILTKK